MQDLLAWPRQNKQFREDCKGQTTEITLIY